MNRLGEIRADIRAAAVPSQRPEPGNGRHRSLEHGVPSAGDTGFARESGTLQFLYSLGWEHINLTGA